MSCWILPAPTGAVIASSSIARCFPRPPSRITPTSTTSSVTVDFPHDKQLPDEVKSQNEALGQKFQIDGFPTLVVLDASGKELGRTSGYDPGSGADAVVAKLKTFESAKP